MAVGMAFVLLACFAFAVNGEECSNEECSSNLVNTLSGSQAPQLLQTNSAEVKIGTVGEAQLDDTTLKLIMDDVKAQSESRHNDEVRQRDLVWHQITAIKGATMDYPWAGKVYQIPAQDSLCNNVYKFLHAPGHEHGQDEDHLECPRGCSCFEVAPLAVAACQNKTELEACTLSYGFGDKDSGMKWGKYTINSICVDLDHDGISVCLPYKMAPCFYSTYSNKKWTPTFFPVGTYCTNNIGQGGQKYTHWKFTLGTCAVNTEYDKKDKPVKCLGEVEYRQG